MSKPADTWMPLYIGDYLRKTMHLTLDQHGAYLMLIMACWCDGGALPDDDEHLAAICRVHVGKWQKLRPPLERFFTIDEAGWHNSRVSEELAKAAGIIQHRRNAGRASVKARAKTKALANGATDVSTKAQQTGRPSPLGDGTEGTEGALGSNLKTKTNLPLSNNETNSAREGGEGSFSKFGWDDPSGRCAPLAADAALKEKRRNLLISKVTRFATAKIADPEVAIAGLMGDDPEHDEQWWLDHLDHLMRAQHWDDTTEEAA